MWSLLKSATTGLAAVTLMACYAAMYNERPDAEDPIADATDTEPPCTPTTFDTDGDCVRKPADCNDNDESIHPAADDTAGDGIDTNCDGEDGIAQTPPTAATCAAAIDDADGDCWRTSTAQTYLYDDCNDSDSMINPAAAEIPGDTIDQNCDGADL